MMRVRPVLAVTLLFFAAAAAVGQEQDAAGQQAESENEGTQLSRLDVPTVVDRVLESNTDVRTARIDAESALASYRQTLANADPGFNLTLTPYGYDSRRIETFAPAPSGGSGAPSGGSGSLVPTQRDTRTHSFGLGLSYNQLLPTSGTVQASVENRMELQTLESTDGLETISQNPSLSFGVRQPLFMNGRFIDMRVFDASRELAELQYERAQTGAEASTNGQLQSALQQYVQVLTLRRQRSRLQESLSVAERRVEQAEVSRAEGQQSEQQVLSARVNANRQREQLLNTRYALRQAETALAKALGIGTALDGVELADRLSVPRPQGSIDELLDRALQTNNRLRQLRIAERIAKQQEILDGQKDSPSLSANVNLEPRYPDQRDDEDALGDSFSSFFEDTAGVNWNVTLQLQIPLSEQKEKRLRGRKNALALEKQEISTADYRTEIRKTIDTLVTRDELLRERIALLETDVEYQKRRVENQQSRVELSTAPQLSVDQLELELRARQNTLFQARTDLFLNRLRLYSLIGEELPAVLEQAYSD